MYISALSLFSACFKLVRKVSILVLAILLIISTRCHQRCQPQNRVSPKASTQKPCATIGVNPKTVRHQRCQSQKACVTAGVNPRKCVSPQMSTSKPRVTTGVNSKTHVTTGIVMMLGAFATNRAFACPRVDATLGILAAKSPNTPRTAARIPGIVSIHGQAKTLFVTLKTTPQTTHSD
jgi:hypothetical protein